MNDVENEKIFEELVENILGCKKFQLDTCFDASVVENFLEQNVVEKKLGNFTISRKIVEERGLARIIENTETGEKIILWPSTSTDDNKNGLKLYDGAEHIGQELDSDQLTNLIFELSEFIDVSE